MLVLGFICNLLVRPVADKYFMTSDELEAERRRAHDLVFVPARQTADGSAQPAA